VDSIYVFELKITKLLRWQVRTTQGTNSSSSFVEYGITSSPNCVQFRINNGSNVFVSRYGDAAMRDSSTIAFYSGPNFTGTLNEVSVANTSNTNINVGSYVFTGSRNSWLVYTAANYNGTRTCIAPQSRVISNGWGHTYSTQTSMTIRSIQLVTSCPTGNTTTTIPPGTTTTRTTTRPGNTTTSRNTGTGSTNTVSTAFFFVIFLNTIFAALCMK